MGENQVVKNKTRSRTKRRRRTVRRLVIGTILLTAVGIWLSNSTQAATLGQTVPQTHGQAVLNYLDTSLRATGATPDGYFVHDWSTVNHTFLNSANLAQIGGEIEQELSIENAKLTLRENANETFYEIDGDWPNQTAVQLVLSSFAPTLGNDGIPILPGSTVLVISATSTSKNVAPLADAYQSLENAVSAAGITPEMSACLEGYCSARIIGVHATNLATEALQAVDAVSLGGLTSTLETSLSGYSPQGLNYILTNGQRMNLQVAVHDDSYANRTNVLVGTPIITTAY